MIKFKLLIIKLCIETQKSKKTFILLLSSPRYLLSLAQPTAIARLSLKRVSTIAVIVPFTRYRSFFSPLVDSCIFCFFLLVTSRLVVFFYRLAAIARSAYGYRSLVAKAYK
ncbi:MAG: hypothetical protein RR307_04650, partial [Clostridia bacterium]